MSTASSQKRYHPESGVRFRPVPPTNAGRKFPAEPLTPDEVYVLLGAASNRSSSGIRLRGIIGVMFGAGLRLGEVLALEPRDAETQAGRIRVREGKGRKSRLAGIVPAGAALLDRWMDRRAQLGLNGRHPIFATYETGNLGRPLQQRYVRHALARLAQRAGLEKRTHPHGLRHSCAFEMAESGMPIHQIQAQLGHASLAVTDRYIRHLNPTDVISTMQEHEWGSRRNGRRGP
jgi:integrase